LKYARPAITEYEKVDEIPFDFNRKRLSVVVRRGDEDFLITKARRKACLPSAPRLASTGRRNRSMKAGEPRRWRLEEVERRRYRALGVAFRKVEKQDAYAVAAERR